MKPNTQNPLDDSIFRTLVEICGEGLIVVDPQWRVKYINKAYTNIFGYTIETLPNGDTFAIVHPDDRAALQGRTEAMIQGFHNGEPIEFRGFHVDGSLRYIEGWGKVLPSGDIVGFLHDITERKKIEMDLRQSEEKYRTLVETSPEAIALVETTGRIVYTNSAFEAHYGYKPEAVIGQLFTDILAFEDNQALETFAYIIGNPGKSVAYDDVKLCHTDGTTRTLSGVGRLLPDGKIVSFSRDNTRQKQAEIALKESEAKFRSLIELSEDGVAIFAPTGEFRYLSPSFTRLFGYTLDELRGTSTFSLLHPDDIMAATQPMYDLLEGRQERIKTEYRMQHKDGSYRYCEGVGSLLPDGNIVAYVSDITERIENQKALENSETKFRTLIETSPNAIITFNEEGKFTYVSPRFTEFFGYTALDVSDMQATDVVYQEDLHLAHEAISELFGGKIEESRLKYRLRHKDGRLRHAEGYGRLLPDRTVVGFINDFTQQHMEDTALRAIVEATASVTGDEFFRSFVKHLALALNVRHVYVTRRDESQKTNAQTLASWSDGKYLPNCNYPLQGTPCQEVWERNFCYYPENIRQLFPDDKLLHDIGAESYMGIALRNSTGQTIGHIAVMDNQAMRDEDVRKRILQIFAARASTEMERLQAEDALILLNAELEQRIEERTAELAATLKEQRQLAAIIEATTDYVGIADFEGWSLYVNQNGRKMVGKTDEDFLKRWNVINCHPVSEHSKLFEMLGKSIAGQADECETILLHKSGKEIPVSMVSVPLKNAEGKVEASAAIMRDISEIKRVENELKQAKESAESALAEARLLSAIIESSTDLIGVSDMNGEMLYLNRTARLMLGIGEDENIIGKSLQNYYSPESWVKVGEIAIPHALLNGSWVGEIEHKTLDGKLIPASIVGIVHRNEAGEPIYMSGVSRDISERKRFEAELKQAKEAAESANRAKSTFLANMSHEIRTPMNAIIGMTSLLLDTPLQAKQADFVETIRSSGDTLLTIINDILDFSKIEAEKLELVYRPLNIRECVESALDLLAPMAAEKHIDLAYVMDENVPPAIVGDVTRLRQILVNFLSNAVKFTAQGEVVVTVSAIPRKGKVRELHFAVRDTGMGIPADKMNRLFKAFSQVDASMTREFGGTGLGLVISKRLSEMMGGTTWAESEGIAGRGATFHFTILAEEAKESVKTFLLGKQPQLKNKRLLIVDDNATNRRILSLQSQTWGMLSHAAALPSEALNLIKTMPFDVAILDMHMPEMDGVALAEAIRKVPECRDLPLIMLTSAMQSGDLSEFAASLSKPVKPSELYNILISLFTSAEESFSTQETQPVKEATSLLADSLPLHILLAEDVLVNQKFAVHALERMGYRADVVANGQEAFDAVMRQVYDVILMDVQMPLMDGLEATRQIRRRSIPQPQIIAMTANAMQGDREICLEAGMDDYISKPVYLQELRAALERAGSRMSKTSEEKIVTENSLSIAEILEMGRDLLEAFLDEIPQNLAELNAAQSGKAISEAAHKIKGSCAYIGAEEAKDIAGRIERFANANDVNNAKLLYGELSHSIQKTMQQLRKALEA